MNISSSLSEYARIANKTQPRSLCFAQQRHRPLDAARCVRVHTIMLEQQALEWARDGAVQVARVKAWGARVETAWHIVPTVQPHALVVVMPNGLAYVGAAEHHEFARVTAVLNPGTDGVWWPRVRVEVLVRPLPQCIVAHTVDEVHCAVQAVWASQPLRHWAHRTPCPAVRPPPGTIDMEAAAEAAQAYVALAPPRGTPHPAERWLAWTAMAAVRADHLAWARWEYQHRLRDQWPSERFQHVRPAWRCHSMTCKYNKCKCGDDSTLSRRVYDRLHAFCGKPLVLISVPFELVAPLVARRHAAVHAGRAYLPAHRLHDTAPDTAAEWAAAQHYADLLQDARRNPRDSRLDPQLAEVIIDALPSVVHHGDMIPRDTPTHADDGPRLSYTRLQDVPHRPACMNTLLHLAATHKLEDAARSAATAVVTRVFAHPHVVIDALPPPPPRNLGGQRERLAKMHEAVRKRRTVDLSTCRWMRHALQRPGHCVDCTGCDGESPHEWLLRHNSVV